MKKKKRARLHNWSMLVSEAGEEPNETQQLEKLMEARLATLEKKWEDRHPDLEVSVVNREGDRIYMGRYYEGVVIRLNGPDGPVTFLTTEMAKQFGEWLVGRQS